MTEILVLYLCDKREMMFPVTKFYMYYRRSEAHACVVSSSFFLGSEDSMKLIVAPSSANCSGASLAARMPLGLPNMVPATFCRSPCFTLTTGNAFSLKKCTKLHAYGSSITGWDEEGEDTISKWLVFECSDMFLSG
jgi:hypothetical protein